MKAFIRNWCVTALGVLAACAIVPGIEVKSAIGLVMAAFLLGVLNAIVRPILILLALPLMLLSLGFFLLFINALLLYWVGHLKDFKVESFWAAFWGSLVISLISLFMHTIWKPEPPKPRTPPTPPPQPPGGPGPIIDV
jgi:putative membrane protein